MKTRIFIITALALAGLVACRRPEAPQPAAQEMTFHATQGDITKTQLKADGSILWSPGDAIRLFFGADASSRFETRISAPAATADFYGSIEALEGTPTGGQVWAVYPYGEDQAFDGSAVTVSVPATQTAVAGGFDQGVFPALARANNFQLSFFNLCGGVKFSVNHSGIKSVRFKGNDGETLAGTVKAAFDNEGNPKVRSVVSGAKEIVLEAPGGTFTPGQWYYIVTLPVTLSKGYTMEFVGDKPVGQRISDRSVTVKRAIWGVLEEADGLKVDTDSFTFQCEGGSASFRVIAGGDWTVSSDAAWCTVSPASGQSFKDVTLQVAENETESVRKANLTVELADHSLRRTVTVTQKALRKVPETVDWNLPFHHKSLVMRFTGTWCGYCPIMGKAVNLALELYPDKLEAVNVHWGGNYNFSYSDQLTSFYGVTGVPTGFVDNRRELENYAYTTTAQNIGKFMTETEANYPVSTAIGFKSTLSGRTVNLDVRLFIKDAASYKVTVFLLENGIVGYQADYTDGDHQDYHHDMVARMVLTDLLGDSFTAGAHERKDLHYSATVPNSYNLDNMTALVYVQRAYGTLPVLSDGDYGGYFVDNALSGPVNGVAVPDFD